ncbi:MAG: DUF4422 domain-containing protein [Lachnospiraceae bacterium]|nr:DUF4422 domain-containing protein [Lachnospiraceae bacterium]
MMDSIKIFISYHKESEVLKSEIMTPIHVGAKNSSVHLDMIRDDEGDNISEKNDRYCELTAQYWAWKNAEADYYGFMHYRRHFVFREVPWSLDEGALAEFDRIDLQYRMEIGLYDDSIRRCVEGYDILIPSATDTSFWGTASNEVQFSSLDNLHAKDFDTVCRTVVDLYPEYEPYVLKFRTAQKAYWYNMFVMKKELFMDYSEWLFTIMENAEKRVDFTGYNQQETRTLAFMAERLFSIWLMKLFDDRPQLKVKIMKMTMVLNTDIGAEEIPIKERAKYREPEKDWVRLIGKSYRELKQLKLPYKLEDIFTVQESEWDEILQTKKIIIYGGGRWCRQLLGFFEKLHFNAPSEIWDKCAEKIKNINGISVIVPTEELLSENKDSYVVVAIQNETAAQSVKDYFESKGIHAIIYSELLKWFAYKLWELED